LKAAETWLVFGISFLSEKRRKLLVSVWNELTVRKIPKSGRGELNQLLPSQAVQRITNAVMYVFFSFADGFFLITILPVVA